MRKTLIIFSPCLIVLLLGCAEVTYFPPEPKSTLATVTPSSQPGPTQVLKGRITWKGTIPKLVEFPAVRVDQGVITTSKLPNPNHPNVDPKTNGMQGVVLELRGVSPTHARPWDHTAPVIKFNGTTFTTSSQSRVAFAKIGDTLTLQNTTPTLTMIRGRGADFFSVALPPKQPKRTRILNKPGKVEITSGGGQFWVMAEVYVSDHPYWAVSNSSGEFEFPQVPPGEYELVCLVRNWNLQSQERDPESGILARLNYKPDWQITQKVTVTPQATPGVEIVFDSTVSPIAKSSQR